jgi:hypothetical protein
MLVVRPAGTHDAGRVSVSDVDGSKTVLVVSKRR